VKNLINDGLVQRRRSAHSDREVVVRLTDKGTDVFRESYPQVIHDVNEFLSSSLNERDRSTLAALLAKVIENPIK
jgi:DNA-binding MarR family transcriptional regulator